MEIKDINIPAQAPEIERGVLGGMIIDSEAAEIALELLKPEDFYKPANGKIFEGIKRLIDKGIYPDILNLEQNLKDNGDLESCGGISYLAGLTRAVSSAANMEYDCEIILEKSDRRQLSHTVLVAYRDINDPTKGTADIIEYLESNTLKLSEGKSLNDSDFKWDVDQTATEIINLKNETGITGIPTGFDLDRITAGWQKGDSIIIAARSSMGKTAFALSAAKSAAKEGFNVGIISLEMSKTSLITRLLCNEAGVDLRRARAGLMTNEERERIYASRYVLKELPIVINDQPGLTLSQIRSIARRWKRKGLDLLMVDYLQIMGSRDRFDTREREVSSFSRGLKNLAKGLDIPVIALSQLNRQVDGRNDKRPLLSDLRESGSIEQDADLVCFLYRPEYYGIKEDAQGRATDGIAEVIVAKHRNGPLGFVNLLFDKETVCFKNLNKN